MENVLFAGVDGPYEEIPVPVRNRDEDFFSENGTGRHVSEPVLGTLHKKLLVPGFGDLENSRRRARTSPVPSSGKEGRAFEIEDPPRREFVIEPDVDELTVTNESVIETAGSRF